MSENFMTAITQINDLIEKKKQIITRTASLVSEAVIDRMKNRNLNATSEKDIKNAIKDFSLEEQVEILTKTVVLVGMNNDSGSIKQESTKPKKKSKGTLNRSDLFGGRY